MAVLRVSGQQELDAAVANVQSGDTILLAAGKYKELKLVSNWQKDYNFTQTVKILSEDAKNPAVVNQMFLRNTANVTIGKIAFTHDGVATPDTESFRAGAPYFVEKVSNLRIDDSFFTGKLDAAGYGQGIGLRLKDSSAVTVVDTRFSDFKNGLNISNSSDLKVSRNVVLGMSNDGMTFGGINGALISENKFRSFHSQDPTSPHKDNIQFRVDVGEAASKNVVIRSNIIDSAEVRHGIYFGNELAKVGVTENATYENILIEGNHIRSAQVHGITVFQGNGIYIRNNTLEQNGDLGYNSDARWVPRINVSKYSDNVLVTGNDVASVPVEENSSWTVSGNDIGFKPLLQWDGTEYAGYAVGAYGEVLERPGPAPSFGITIRPQRADKISVIDVNGDIRGDQLIFDAGLIDDGTRVVINGLDIPGGKSLTLVSFADDTFVNGADANLFSIWANGAGARFDSMLDFHEADARSPHVYMHVEGDDLVMDVRAFRGTAEIVLTGLAAAYQTGDPFDLY